MKLPLLKPCPHGLPTDEFGTRSQVLRDLGQSSAPVAVMLTCWELGSAPDQVSHASPGEIIVVQNPGGMVAAADMHDRGATLDSLLCGLDFPTVRHLIVCGHTDCQTLGLLLGAGLEDNPFGKLVQPVRERLQATYREGPAQARLGLMVQETILQQLANLRSHAAIATRLRQKTLHLHGWIRSDRTAAITAYDPLAGQFCDAWSVKPASGD